MDPSSLLRGRCIRLDVIYDTELRLDDVGAMAKLKAKAEADPALQAAVDDVARRFTAALFYFELDSLPRRSGFIFSAKGTILYRCETEGPALTLLRKRLLNEGAEFVLNDRVLPTKLPSSTRPFEMAVPLQLTSENFSLSLRWPNGAAYPISGSPFSLTRLVEEQGLDAPFGLAIPGHTPRRPPSVAPKARTSPRQRGAKRPQEETMYTMNKLRRYVLAQNHLPLHRVRVRYNR